MISRDELHVFLRGGLGNQLFQYSTGVHVAESINKKLILRTDLLPATEDQIGGVSRWPNQIETFSFTGEIRARLHQPSGNTDLFGKIMQFMRMLGDVLPEFTNNMGWLASEKTPLCLPSNLGKLKVINSYVPFKEIAWRNRERLRAEILEVRNVRPKLGELIEEMSKAPRLVVHIRQGDYQMLNQIYGGLSLKFLKSAIEKFTCLDPSLSVWLFTDSPSVIGSTTRKLLGVDRTIGPGELERPIDNLLLMSKGTAFIASNSSFSWWAAFLGEDSTRVVAPFFRSARINNFDLTFDTLRGWDVIDVSEAN
jgi:hypothetical protein